MLTAICTDSGKPNKEDILSWLKTNTQELRPKRT